jgi:hypothetical protein
VLFAEGVPDQCVAGCSQGDPDVLGLYAFESMTLQIGLETYTWTNGTRTEVFNDQHFPPGPCDAVECGPPPPDQVRDGFFLESDPYWYAFAIPRTDRVHALLALQDFTATRLTSDAVPSPSELALPGSPPWTSQLNMYAENADATQTIWALGADVTSSSARTVPEPGALQWLLLGLGAFLARPAR